MSTTFVDEVTSPFTAAHEAFDDVAGVELALLPRDEFLQGWRDFERLVNRMAAMRHRFIAEAERQFMPAEHGGQVERDLVELARQFDPSELGRLGQRMTTLLDQDGALDDSRRRERNRSLAVHQRADGSAASRPEVSTTSCRAAALPCQSPTKGDLSSLPSAKPSTPRSTSGMDGQASELRRARS